jgi:DNA-binding MarR family transcriptional regulator
MPLRLVPSIHRATHRIGLYLADLSEERLTQGEAHILAHLAVSRPATIADLHRGLAHQRSTLTSILDRLVARGLITRTVGVDDRRTFVIDTTPKGRRAARRVHDHLVALETSVGRTITSEEMRTFLKVLSAIEGRAHESTRAARARR